MATFTGVVKSFGAGKGFGFIGCDQLEGDVFFQLRDLPPQLQASLAGVELKGATVAFELHHAADGKQQARGVQLLSAGGAPRARPPMPGVGLALAARLPPLPCGACGPGGMITQAQLLQLQRQHLGGAPGEAEEQASQDDADQRFAGTVSSYNDAKGFGFITCDMLPTDSYFQKRDLPPQLQNQGELLVGTGVSFMSHMTQDGKLQARRLMVDGYPAAPPAVVRGAIVGQPAVPLAMMQQMLPDGAKMVGEVKNCEMARGYGFISAGGLPSDAYFKLEGAHWSPGQKVSFTLKWMRDGKPQAHDVSAALEGGEVLTGMIKSFSDRSGYGFIDADGYSQDLYFKQAALPLEMQGCQSQQLVGCHVQCTVRLKPDGKPAAQDVLLSSGPQGGAPQGHKRPADFAAGFEPMYGDPKRRV